MKMTVNLNYKFNKRYLLFKIKQKSCFKKVKERHTRLAQTFNQSESYKPNCIMRHTSHFVFNFALKAKTLPYPTKKQYIKHNLKLLLSRKIEKPLKNLLFIRLI